MRVISRVFDDIWGGGVLEVALLVLRAPPAHLPPNLLRARPHRPSSERNRGSMAHPAACAEGRSASSCLFPVSLVRTASALAKTRPERGTERAGGRSPGTDQECSDLGEIRGAGGISCRDLAMNPAAKTVRGSRWGLQVSETPGGGLSVLVTRGGSGELQGAACDDGRE